MNERKYTAPMSGEKRKTQILKAAVKLAKKGGRVTLAGIAEDVGVTPPLVANYMGRGPAFEKSIRDAAKAAGVTIPESFCVQGGNAKPVVVKKSKAIKVKKTAKQVKKIKEKAAAAPKAKRIPKPKPPTTVAVALPDNLSPTV